MCKYAEEEGTSDAIVGAADVKPQSDYPDGNSARIDTQSMETNLGMLISWTKKMNR